MGVNRALIWLPLAMFAALLTLAASGLFRPEPQQVVVQSALMGKSFPAIALPPMLPDKPGIPAQGGGPRLVNVFASWCVPCIAEAPQLMALKQAGARIDGIAIRDSRANIAAFLARHGDPFARVGDDPQSTAQLTLGSSGVPETFVVDARGIIRHQHIGDVRAENVPELLRMLEAAR
jgi:cytochrome c biogenesis protein CcmG, thiol:disulfide interchange protein DsbE